MVENRGVVRVQFDDVPLLWRDFAHILQHLVVDNLVVHVDVFERRVEDVAEDGDGASELLINQLRQFTLAAHLCHAGLPTLHERLNLRVHVFHRLAFRHGAHDDAEVLGLHAPDNLFDTVPFFVRFDFLGNEHLVRPRDKHQKSSCDGYLRRQSRTFGGDWLLGDLHEYLLPLGEQVRDFPAFLDFLLDLIAREGETLLLPAQGILHERIQRQEVWS